MSQVISIKTRVQLNKLETIIFMKMNVTIISFHVFLNARQNDIELNPSFTGQEKEKFEEEQSRVQTFKKNKKYFYPGSFSRN